MDAAGGERAVPFQVQAIPGDFWEPSIPERWDRCVPPGHLGLTHRFLRCSRELHMEGGFQMAPLMLADPAGKTLGVASSYHTAVDGADLVAGRIRNAMLLVRKLFPSFLKYDVLEIGPPAGVSFPAYADAPGARSMDALARWAMEEAKRRRNCLVVVRDVNQTTAAGAVAALERLGFQPTPLQPTFIISLPFGSFDEYRSAIRSKYRWRLTNHLKSTASLRCEVVRDFAPLAPELIALWRNLYDRVTRYRRLMVTQSFLEAVSGLDESRVLLLRRPDDTIAGFGLVYLDGPMLRYSITGFTREAAREEGVYYRMLYEVIRFAIENGCKAASLGQSTAEPKMRIGGRPVPLQAWIWHRSGVRRQLLGWLARTWMRPPVIPLERNVFKDDVPEYPDPALAEQSCS